MANNSWHLNWGMFTCAENKPQKQQQQSQQQQQQNEEEKKQEEKEKFNPKELLEVSEMASRSRVASFHDAAH